MQSIFRDPQVEESIHSIILQNRCGNRLSLLIHEDRTDLEFIYKPSAFRRKEYRARNFSSRDNFTTLFAAATAAELHASFIKDFNYDPFVTRLTTLAPSGGKNSLTFLNIADENCFAVAARCPLTLTFRPKQRFEVSDGLLLEQFTDRGEEIVSFVAFPGFDQNRYRVLDDGTHILQLLENDVILIGGEENRYQVTRLLKALRPLNLQQLIERNEALLAPVLNRARLTVKADAAVQRVIDINKRFTYSGLDEGGACFGAVNRIYHLIWTRDGSMSNSQYAMAGIPEFIRIWAPFLLQHPGTIRENDRAITAWQQLFGTRWTKSEDDGLFYTTWSLFTYFNSTGDDSPLRQQAFDLLLTALDDAIATRFDKKLGLFASDTRGESSLASSPYFGYDIVNGQLDTHRVGTQTAGKVLSRSCSLYNNILQYNVLRMLLTLLQQRPDLKLSHDYAKFAADLQARINSFFIDDTNQYRAEYLFYSDGSEGFSPAEDRDWWEYAWALSLCPYHPNIAAAVISAREYVQYWPKQRGYGFSPWNTLTALLHEYGLPAAQARKMLDIEIQDALALTKRYPMPGLITEYTTQPEGWRGLPFSASSFNLTITSMLLKPLAQGLAVRAGGIVDKLENFTWCIYRLDVTATGKGDAVASLRLNGRELTGTLQLPQSALRPGRNIVEVQRGPKSARPRLYSSTLMLLDAREQNGKTILEFAPSPLGELVLENIERPNLRSAAGKTLKVTAQSIPETALHVFQVDASNGVLLEL